MTALRAILMKSHRKYLMHLRTLLDILFSNHMKRWIEGKKYRVLCPTHKALTEMETKKDDKGTIHKFVNVNLNLKSDEAKAKNLYDWIIIDEKSMVAEKFIKFLYLYKRK